MDISIASEIVRDFLMDKRVLDSEVREAIRTQYILSGKATDKEGNVA